MSGTYVAGTFCKESIAAIQSVQNQLLPYCLSGEEIVTPAKMHVTICYSMEPIDFPDNIDCNIVASVSGLVNIGNAIALNLYCPALSNIYKTCRMLGATNKFSGYTAHASLYYNNKMDAYKIRDIVLPDVLNIINIYSEPLKND